MTHHMVESGAHGRQAAFIDTGLTDWGALVSGLPHDVEPVLLGGETGAITQIRDWALARQGYSALHLFTHGSPGQLHFQAGAVHAGNVDDFGEQFEDIRKSLAPGADLLIYACNVANHAGNELIHRLQALLNVNIAAPTGAVGSEHLGGTWNLAYRLGAVETHPVTIDDYRYVMAAPQFVSTAAYIGQSTVTLTFDQTLDAANPPPSSFFYEYQGIPGGNPPIPGVVLINGSTVSISAIQVVGSTVVLTVGATFTAGDVVDVVYDDNSNNNEPLAIQNAAGEDAPRTVNQYTVTGGPPGPTVTSIVEANSATVVPASSPSVTYTVTFSSAVTGVDVSDFSLALTGTAQGTVSAISGSGSTYSVTVSGVSGDGSMGLNLNSNATGIQDVSNQPISGGYTGQVLTVDHTAPLAPATLALASGSDSGTLGDGVTNDPTPTITGTAEPNATVRLYDTDGTTVLGTATANGSGNWSITSSTVVEGNHTFTAKQTDAAGNVSPASANFAFRLDTVGPTGTALSRTTVPMSSATNGSTVATVTATDASSVTYSFATGNGVIDADNAKFTFSGNALVASQTLSAGTYNIYVRATDAAGNDALQTLSFTVVNAPGVNSIVRAGAAAATAPAAANSVTYTVTFDQSVTGVDASDFGLTTTGSAAGTIASVTGSGATYTVTVNGITGDGTVRLDLNANGTGIQSTGGTAIVGGYTSGQTFTLDHTAPLAPGAFMMNAADDTGISSSDAVTSVNTPRFTGVAEANATVRLYDTDGTTLLGSTTADGSGNWTITSSTLSDGSHTLQVRQTDAAGNVSPNSASLAVTIDQSTIAPSTPVLAVSSDTGTVGDGLTSTATPTITGTAEAFATITLYDTDGVTSLGTATANASGAWSIVSSTLSQGAHSLTVNQTDLAGSVSSASQALSLTIDVTAPAVGGAPVLSPSSDSDAQGDGITNVSRPVVTGTAEPNATITLYDTNGTTILGTATANGTGNWSITSSSLSAGPHTLTFKQTDAAGNVSLFSSGLTLTITQPPPPPTTTIDGVQVGETNVNLPGGGTGTEISIPIVTSGRAETTGSAGVADIPLSSAGSNTLLLAQVGVGFGLTSSGGASQAAGSSLERLIASIIAATPDHPSDDQAYLTGNGRSFLGLLPTTVPLLVQTVTPVTGATAPTSALTLVGTSTDAQRTALVIDVEGASSASTINLKAVDFAAIIGAATITGDTKDQILAGDAAGQKFVVDANLGSSIFAGGGLDTLQVTTSVAAGGGVRAVQAAAPADSDSILHGGTGADVAVFAGARSNYNIAISDAHVVVSSSTPGTAAAYVVNVETLQFADQAITVQSIASMGAIAGLYVDVLDRQGEIAGLEFWAAAAKNGVTLGEIALHFIDSTEGRTQQQVFNGAAAHDVEILYEALFNRHSDAAGLAFWVNAMDQGATLANVVDGFMHSPEAQAHVLGATQWDFLL